MYTTDRAGRRVVARKRTLTFCNFCKRIEFMSEHGPFFWRCDECSSIQAKDI